MAKNDQPRSKDPSKWSEITYIRCELDNQLKKDLQAWLKEKHDWLGYIEQAVGAGYRFGTHHDAFNDCVEARLTLMSNSIGINTLVLQGRGPDLLTAIQSLFFKHFIVLEQRWEDLDRDKRGKYSEWG